MCRGNPNGAAALPYPDGATAKPDADTITSLNSLVAATENAVSRILALFALLLFTPVAPAKPRELPLGFVTEVVPEYLVEPPFAYLVPAKCEPFVESLQRRGVTVMELREDIRLEVSPRGSEQRRRCEERFIPAGTFVVKTGQPQGSLAAWVLEAQDQFPLFGLLKPYPLTLGPAPALPENRVVNQAITEALLIGHGGGFSFGLQGTPVSVGDWIDAEHFLQTKEGKLWKVNARTGKAEAFTNPALISKSLRAVKELDPEIADQTAKGRSFRMNPDRTAFLVESGGLLALGYFDGRPAVVLSKRGPRLHLSFSPDGKQLAFIRNANLFALDIEKAEETQLTHDGGGEIRNGEADWVYEEEIFNRNGQAYWWSPDGKQLAFLRFDDTRKAIQHCQSRSLRGQLESYPYPKVGDPNPTVKIGVVSVGGGKPAFLDFGPIKPEDIIVTRVGWFPDSKTVFAYVQNRTQTWLDFTTWPALDSKPKVLLRDTTKAWVDDTGPPQFLPDGSFLFASDRSGWRHLYHYTAEGKLLGPVTSGEWEVKDVLRVDGPDKTVYFTATMTNHNGTDLCRVKLGEKPELLTEKGRTHRVSLAPSGLLFVDRFSDVMTPMKAAVVEAGKGEVRILDTNPVREKDGFKFGKFERVKIPMKDGFELEAAITYPPEFDRSQKHPVWVFTYAGPHMPTIRDEWGGGRIMDNTLATNGIIVMRVDPRSASGKGAQSAWTCYKQLGVQELKDLEEAVAWLAAKPGVDASRVGISGHSYGGFMAAFALTHSKTFSAGIASGPVTDWKFYDTIYTERYMLTPKENPDGYAKTSCVVAAKNLTGKLLIIHGMMDDNVHMQNSTQFVDALQRSAKDFEMMFYPQARHGIGGAHYLKLQLEFIRRTMGVQK
ncbi:MAG: S9 family peptidase [Gemmataceae bacterium]